MYISIRGIDTTEHNTFFTIVTLISESIFVQQRQKSSCINYLPRPDYILSTHYIRGYDSVHSGRLQTATTSITSVFSCQLFVIAFPKRRRASPLWRFSGFVLRRCYLEHNKYEYIRWNCGEHKSSVKFLLGNVKRTIIRFELEEKYFTMKFCIHPLINFA